MSMIGDPGAEAQRATVIKRRLSGCRSGGVLEYLESGFLPHVVQPEFPAALSATGSGDLQPWL